MNELILELKKDLTKEKLLILNILLTQLDLYETQLKKTREAKNYFEQMKLIDDLMEEDIKKAA